MLVRTYVCSPQHLNIMALFLGLHTSYLYQVVRNCLRNIIASEKFFKIFNSFWDICHVLIFWLRKKMGAKIDFFSENFNFEPRHNKVISNCGELHKEYFCPRKVFQNIYEFLRYLPCFDFLTFKKNEAK